MDRIHVSMLAQHLARRADADSFGRPQLVSGVLPGELPARHYWLEVIGVIVDLTADPLGEAPVIVGERTAFHQSLSNVLTEDAIEAPMEPITPASAPNLILHYVTAHQYRPPAESPRPLGDVP